MGDPSAISNIYGIYALIVVQLFGLIKIYIDRVNTKKQRDEALEALRIRQGEISTMVDDCKNKSDTIVIMEKDIGYLKEHQSNASNSIEKINTSYQQLHIEVTRLASNVASLTENVNRIAISLEKLFDKLDKK